MNIQCKRVYDPAEQSDGYRVLVDRLWPRGIKKTDLALDEWDKEITPSTELRNERPALLLAIDRRRICHTNLRRFRCFWLRRG